MKRYTIVVREVGAERETDYWEFGTPTYVQSCANELRKRRNGRVRVFEKVWVRDNETGQEVR
jgi:hypothetical protein